MRNIAILSLYVTLFFGCPSSNPDNSWREANTNGEDHFWSNCALLSVAELDELDALQKQLIKSDAITNDKIIFDKYLKLLTLTDKSDEQILSATSLNPEQRKRLMKHFVFLGLTYGKGHFSFVDNPRLASLFEMHYFYFPRNFLGKSRDRSYSNADKKLAHYLLGALITMQASVKMQEGMRDAQKIIAEITKGFSTLKYGRTLVFTQLILELGEKLGDKLAAFLLKDREFIDNFEALNNQHIQAKTYPTVLEKDHPNWPRDYSEVVGSIIAKEAANTVFGMGSGGTPLGTGFFAKSGNDIIFLTSGHWKYNRTLSIMRQKDADPFGFAPSEFIWLKNRLDLFNFSEELIVPTLKALGFDDIQIGEIKRKLGDNPFASSFTLVQQFMPWLDIALAIPSAAVIAEGELKLNDIKQLKDIKLQEGTASSAYTLAFGSTEDLESGDPSRNKSPGLRRFNEGSIYFEKVAVGDGPSLLRALFHTPQLLNQIAWWPTMRSVFSMRFGSRCSGAPFFAEGGVVGLLQGPFERNGSYEGLRMVEFTPQNLALIQALISDPRGLFNIPENDLIQMVRAHIFFDAAQRKTMHDLIKAKYL